jgi:hypothetical protein
MREVKFNNLIFGFLCYGFHNFRQIIASFTSISFILFSLNYYFFILSIQKEGV